MNDVILKATLDVGSSKVKAILGELSDSGNKIRVLGFAEETSQGVRKSKVESVESLSESIRNVIEKLEEQTGKFIKKASIGVGGNHLKSETRNIRFNFLGDEEIVEEEHLEKLYELAEEYVTSDEYVIKKELYNLRVDGSGILKNPIGVVGGSLEGDVHLVTADKGQLELLIEASNRAGVGIEDITLNSYASAQAVLTAEDKRMGVALVDIGEGSTDIIIFKNDKFIYAESIPIGGMHYVNDLAYMFKLSKKEALNLKEVYSGNRNKENIEIDVNGEKQSFSGDKIREIFNARSEDIVNYLSKALEESGFKGYLGNGIILTGGAVNMSEVVEELAKNLNYKVKVGDTIKVRGMTESLPSYSTALGILLEVLEKEHNKINNPNIQEASIEEEIKEVKEKKVHKEKVKAEKVQVSNKKEKKKKEKKQENKKVKKEGIFDNMKSWIKEFI